MAWGAGRTCRRGSSSSKYREEQLLEDQQERWSSCLSHVCFLYTSAS